MTFDPRPKQGAKHAHIWRESIPETERERERERERTIQGAWGGYELEEWGKK